VKNNSGTTINFIYEVGLLQHFLQLRKLSPAVYRPVLSECGLITDEERSINVSKNIRFGLTTFVLLFTQAVLRICPHDPSLNQVTHNFLQLITKI